MKATVTVKVNKGYDDNPINVTIEEELIEGNFDNDAGAESIRATINALATEAVTRAETQVKARRMLAETADV